MGASKKESSSRRDAVMNSIAVVQWDMFNGQFQSTPVVCEHGSKDGVHQLRQYDTNNLFQFQKDSSLGYALDGFQSSWCFWWSDGLDIWNKDIVGGIKLPVVWSYELIQSIDIGHTQTFHQIGCANVGISSGNEFQSSLTQLLYKEDNKIFQRL